MASISLSRDLTSVLDKLPAPLTHLAPGYRETITRKGSTLDPILSNAANLGSQDRLTAAFQAISNLLSGRVFGPDHDEYKGHVERNWTTTCWLPANCIIRPQNAVEVALALKVATRLQVQFAIRSVGHMGNPGFSSVGQSGILLDLGDINHIDVSEGRDAVTVGPAATWDQVYDELEKYERTVVGGRASGVGVSGLVLGGGMSHFSNHWGLVCDNVKTFEVVLADSSIVYASSVANTDLFWALKGGSSNFGVVTQVEMNTFPEYKLWANLKVIGIAKMIRVAEATVQIQKAMEVDDRIGFFLSIMSDNLTVGLLYRGEAPGPSVFKAFNDMPVVAEPVPGGLTTQGSLCKMLAMPGPKNNTHGVITTRPNAALYVHLQRTILDISASLPPSASQVFTIQPIGEPAVKVGQQNGGNCINFPPEPQSWLAMVTSWTDNDQAKQAEAQHLRFITSVEAVVKEHDQYLDFQFLNDARSSQTPLQSYGATNLRRLATISQKFDPNGVFQHLQNDGFLLSKTKAPEP